MDTKDIYSLPEMATLLGYNPFYFSRKVKAGKFEGPDPDITVIKGSKIHRYWSRKVVEKYLLKINRK